MDQSKIKNFAELNEKILIPKRLPTGDLNDAYPSSAGITIYICVATDKNIPVKETGFVESFKYDDNATIQLFYSLNRHNAIRERVVNGVQFDVLSKIAGTNIVYVSLTA